MERSRRNPVHAGENELPVKLVYFAPSDIQVARTDRQCIVSFCSALDQLGVDVELVSIGIKVMPGEARGTDPLGPYRIRRPFPTTTLRVPVSQESSPLWLALNRFAAHGLAAIRIAVSVPRARPLILYTKTYSTGILLSLVRRLGGSRRFFVFEAHVPAKNAVQRHVLRTADRVIANTAALAHDLVAARLVEPSRVLGTHQGVDLGLFDELRVSTAAARAQLDLPQNKRLVIYTGKVYWGYAEVEYILDAARMLENRDDVHFVLVGGRYDHVERYRRRVESEDRKNVLFAGFVAPTAVPMYQFAADVLVLYYPSSMELNAYRSPAKLFEYMASERPIVAVDLPVLREVLGDPPAAVLVPPDAPPVLAAELEKVLGDDRLASDLSSQARSRAAEFTWARRAETVMRFVSGDGHPDECSRDST